MTDAPATPPAAPVLVDRLDEHPDACGVTETHGCTEFVCIAPVHASERDYRRGDFDGQGNAARHRRHHMVNRWPNRPPSPECPSLRADS